MSTGKQTQENSPARQRDYLELYTKKLGINYNEQVIEFSDPGESGFKVKAVGGKELISRRKGFALLWECINACRVPCEVFVYDISRYSRHDQVGVQELSIALGMEGKEHQRIEKFHIAETEEIYTIDTPGSKISGDIRAKMQESEGKRRKSNGNIKIWTEKKILPKMVAGTLSSNKVFEWVSENGLEGVRKGPNFPHIEKVVDMRIEGRTLQEMHDYLVRNGLKYSEGNLHKTIFSNQVFIGIYCPEIGKNKGEITELRFLDCVTPISPEKWEKLQKTIKHKVPYRSRQVGGVFIRPVIDIMRYMGGDMIGGHFGFYDKMKSGERYWYIRYRKGKKTYVEVSLLEILRQFIKQQGFLLFEVYYNVSRCIYEESCKNSETKSDFISKDFFGLSSDFEQEIKKELFYILPKNVNIDGAWVPVDFSKMSFIEGVYRFIDYYKSIEIGEEGEDSNRGVFKQIESMHYLLAQIFNWACCHIGDEDMRKMFLKNISSADSQNIEQGKMVIEHMINEIRKKEKEIQGINDRIIDGIITKDLLPLANEKKEAISQEMIQIQKKIVGLEHSSDIEKHIASLPGIIRKIGELTKKPFTEKDFGKEFPQIVKLLEITCGELTLTKEKALKIGLYEVLERLRDIDNLNWQSSWESNPDQRLWRPLY